MSGKRPPWLVQKAPRPEDLSRMKSILARHRLNTVCREARCPNQGECFARGTATFMILGNVCTRNCSFCSVYPGRPIPPDPEEPLRVARAAEELQLRHVVVTSVTRDDLEDGGAGYFAQTIRKIRSALPSATIEVLIPDFQGQESALQMVLEAGPDILGHNLETVPRLYPLVRPRADYLQSLHVLRQACEKGRGVLTKSALLLGLGETVAEVEGVMQDLRGVGCSILALGQYLQPTPLQTPVREFIPPSIFSMLGRMAEEKGFVHVISAPLVRSSYHSEEIWERAGRREQVEPTRLVPEAEKKG